MPNAPQTNLKLIPNATQTPLRSETSKFYIGPGLGVVAPLSLLSILASLVHANKVQTHPKRTSNASQI